MCGHATVQARPCCSNITQCEVVANAAAKPQCQLMLNNSISFTCLSFEKLLLQAEPDLYKKVDWFSAHSYPCAVRATPSPSPLAPRRVEHCCSGVVSNRLAAAISFFLFPSLYAES